MEFFRRFRSRPEVEGYIGHFGLVDWWFSEFTQEEREYIDSKYSFFGAGEHRGASFTKGSVVSASQTASGSLWSHATNFRSAEDRHLARRLLTKAANTEDATTLDKHFAYGGLIEVYYKDRDKELGALDAAIAACEKQIEIAPDAAREFRRQYPDAPLPRHGGFPQLAIIREKQGQYEEAIRLSEQANEQGWPGDWKKRIARLKKKLAKS